MKDKIINQIDQMQMSIALEITRSIEFLDKNDNAKAKDVLLRLKKELVDDLK
jgi:hypothetical protein